MAEEVGIHRAEGSSMSWNLNLLSGPKFYLECGKCGAAWSERLPVVEDPKVICPECRTTNVLPFTLG